MARCKTKGCQKEAVAGSEYCPACGCQRDKRNKNAIKTAFSVLVLAFLSVLPFLKSSDSK